MVFEMSEEDRVLLENSQREYSAANLKRAQAEIEFNECLNDFHTKEANLARIHLDIVHKVIVGECEDVNNLIVGQEYCDESPVKRCIYHALEDVFQEECLICGQPAERK